MADRPRSSPRSRWQFGLKGLMLVMLVVAVGAAGVFNLIQPATSAAPRRLIGTLMLLATPLMLMTLVSLLRSLGRKDG